jgi:acetyl-CoA carboxylase biotin carboxyl carrier protein
MQVDDVRQLSAWIAATDIDLLELQGPEHHVCLRRHGTQVVVVAPEDEVPEAPVPTVVVTAPCVGVFLHRHPLRTEPLAPAGAAVRAGQVVGLLQIGALLVPVNASHGAIVERALAAHGATVGFGEPLLELQAL